MADIDPLRNIKVSKRWTIWKQGRTYFEAENYPHEAAKCDCAWDQDNVLVV